MTNGPRLPVDLRDLLAHGPVVVGGRLGRLPFREHVGAHLLLGPQEPIFLILQPPQVLVGTSRCEFHTTTSFSRRSFDGVHHTRCQQQHSTVPLVRFAIDTFTLLGQRVISLTTSRLEAIAFFRRITVPACERPGVLRFH